MSFPVNFSFLSISRRHFVQFVHSQGIGHLLFTIGPFNILHGHHIISSIRVRCTFDVLSLTHHEGTSVTYLILDEYVGMVSAKGGLEHCTIFYSMLVNLPIGHRIYFGGIIVGRRDRIFGTSTLTIDYKRFSSSIFSSLRVLS